VRPEGKKSKRRIRCGDERSKRNTGRTMPDQLKQKIGFTGLIPEEGAELVKGVVAPKRTRTVDLYRVKEAKTNSLQTFP
jgi:hypothetical protein